MRNLKRALSLALATVMTLGLMVVGTGAVGYTDVTSEDNQEAIEVLQEVGIMTGVTDDEFNPDGLVTRNQMAVIMSQLLNLDYDYYRGINTFTDVPTWAAPYVAACVAEGVTAGIGNNLYGGENNVTAAQAALMLMKALGYFQYQDDFTPDWQVATIRQGSYINLFDLVDANAEEALTRSQVAQMVLNALKANMVEFTGDVGMSINGVTVGYRPEYTARTNAANKYNTIDVGTTNIAQNDQYYVQLGEELYDGDLELDNSATDPFGRPARHWEYDGKDIGDYVKTELMRNEYTVSVTGADIYNDLGTSSIRNSELYVFEDGVETDSITKNQLARSYKDTLDNTGKGVLTQVFYDANAGEDGEITITQINTYLAKATSDYNERTDRVNMQVYGFNATTDQKAAANAAFNSITSEDIPAAADLVKDQYVLVTIADGEMQTIEDVEILSDVALNGVSIGNKVIADGTPYEFADAQYYDNTILADWDKQNMENTTYNLYLDQYGYLLGIDEFSGATNYVFITGYDYDYSNIASGITTANAIFTDGTMHPIKVNNEKSDGTWDDPNGASLINAWYSYSVNSDEVYTLKEVDYVWDRNQGTINSAYVGLRDSNSDSRWYYGNNETNYIIVDPTDGLKTLNGKDAISKIDSVVTGVKNVDIDVYTYTDAGMDGDVSHGAYAVYNSNNYIIAAVVIGENQGRSANYAYVIDDDPNLESIYSDREGYWYWEFDVITADEGITTKTVKGEYGELDSIITDGAGMYRFTYDEDGYVVGSDYETAINGWTATPDLINDDSTTMGYSTTAELDSDGETIYNNAATAMRGVALAPECGVYTVQVIDGDVEVENWSGDAIAAVDALAYNENNTVNKRIYTIFNGNGEAEVLVLVVDTDYQTSHEGDYGSDGNLTFESLGYASSKFSLTVTTDVQIPGGSAAEYSVTITTKDGVKVASVSGVSISLAKAPGDSFVMEVPYTTSSAATGDYIVSASVVDVATGSVIASETNVIHIA